MMISTHIDWFVLIALAEEHNITKASEKLFMSQPAITRRLKNLEQEFDTTIVLRTPNGITFTPQGLEILSFAKKDIVEYRHLKEYIHSIGDRVDGPLAIGTSSVFAHYELPLILKTFLEKYSKVDISLKTGLSPKISRLLQSDEINIAVLRGDYSWDEGKILLSEEPICLVSSTPIDLKYLPNIPRIFARSAVQGLAEEWYHQNYNCAPKSTTEVDSIDTCRQMVIRGLGWAILPGIGLKQQNHNLYIKNLYFKDGTPLTRKTWLMYRNEYLKLPAARAFIEHIRNYFKV